MCMIERLRHPWGVPANDNIKYLTGHTMTWHGVTDTGVFAVQ